MNSKSNFPRMIKENYYIEIHHFSAIHSGRNCFVLEEAKFAISVSSYTSLLTKDHNWFE